MCIYIYAYITHLNMAKNKQLNSTSEKKLKRKWKKKQPLKRRGRSSSPKKTSTSQESCVIWGATSHRCQVFLWASGTCHKAWYCILHSPDAPPHHLCLKILYSEPCITLRWQVMLRAQLPSRTAHQQCILTSQDICNKGQHIWVTMLLMIDELSRIHHLGCAELAGASSTFSQHVTQT